MAEVKVLRTERAPAAPQLGRERADLAEAIEQYEVAAAYLDKARAAKAKANAAWHEANRAVEAAEQALRDAEAVAPAARLAALMGDAVQGTSLDTARAALDAAKTRREAAAEDERLVGTELSRADEKLEWARRRRDQALVAVLANSAEVAGMRARWHAAHDEIEALGAAIAALPADANPTYWAARPYIFRPDKSLAEKWQAAVAALEQDASAALPALDPPPAEAA